jgi:hypothetical protein
MTFTFGGNPETVFLMFWMMNPNVTWSVINMTNGLKGYVAQESL